MTKPPERSASSKRQSVVGLTIALVVCFGAAGIGGLATTGSVDTWYRTLAKPSFTPPDALFGPVWSVLYALMAVAVWRVWRAVGWSGGYVAIAVFGLQLALNVAWSLLFFGGQQIGLALLEIIALWLAIATTIGLFWRHDRLAAWLLVPYLVWVSYATALNAAIWSLNSA